MNGPVNYNARGTCAYSMEQAMALANVRAERSGIRQRVAVCICRNTMSLARRHFIVKPVDRVPSSVMA